MHCNAVLLKDLGKSDMAAKGLLPVRWMWVQNVARPHAMTMAREKRHYGGLLTVLLHTMG